MFTHHQINAIREHRYGEAARTIQTAGQPRADKRHAVGDWFRRRAPHLARPASSRRVIVDAK